MIIIILLLIIILIFFNLYENYQNHIYFLNKNETIKFISDDNDNYLKNMSIYDLFARKVSNYKEYINLIINNCLDFNNEQIRIIKKYSNGKTFKIALINKIYEEGLPHTREDIIFISPELIKDNINLERIIKHELIHINQRFNKKLYKNYIISRRRNTEPLIRANPDLDEYIYKNLINNLELYYIYSSNQPKGINDIIKINNLEEHPNEIEAYENEK